MRALPRVGVAISTIGRHGLAGLLASAARSSHRPTSVVVADQSGGGLELDVEAYPFPVQVVPSSGGVSAGRNAAAALLGQGVDVVAFPNDDSTYPASTLEGVARAFAGPRRPDAVACSLEEYGRPRFVLPSPGTALDRVNVWRAIEPATFMCSEAFEAAAGFRQDLGSGAGTPWGSGEGTDLLLRMMSTGGLVLSRADLRVHGPGDRRDLSAEEYVSKHRSYARGTGYVYAVHGYPPLTWLRVLAGPVVKVRRQDPDLRLSVRLAGARTHGRLEGLRAGAAERRAARTCPP